MMRMTFAATLLAAALPLLCQAQVGGLVAVQADGSITPSNTVATIEDHARAIAEAQGAAALALAVQTVQTIISQELARVQSAIVSRESTGYIQGFVLSFDDGVAVDTNATAQIVKLSRAGSDGSNTYATVYTYFSTDPGESALPYVRYIDALGRSNEWSYAEAAGDPYVTNIVAAGESVECYANPVKLPASMSNAFFRVYSQMGSVSGANFPVKTGISPGGRLPLTCTFTAGTNVIRIVGGIVVQ